LLKNLKKRREMTITDLIVFIYESGVCMAVLFAMYWFFLRKETYFRFNRFYLMGSILVACVLPVIHPGQFENGHGIYSWGGITGIADTINIPAVTITGGLGNVPDPSINWQHLIVVIYLTGAFLLIARMTLGILRLIILRRSGRKECFDGYSIFYLKHEMAPFSFFNTIYLSGSLTEGADKEYIVSHERIHIRQLHTLDNLFAELSLAILWFNPFMWFLRTALRDTHEYLADNGVLTGNVNRTSYQSLLLKQISGLFPLVVTSSFNSTIKNRLKMMRKSKSSALAKFKPLLLVPILTFLTLVFACNDMQVEPAIDNSPESMPDEMIPVTKQIKTADESQADAAITDGEVFYVVEEMPTFNGGDPAIEFRKFIAENLWYPEPAAEAGIQGRVIVQFRVSKEGEVVDAVVVRGVSPELDQEAVRVTMSSPKWTPGKQHGKAVDVLFTFPLNFVQQ
jgi:TonB family protein